MCYSWLCPSSQSWASECGDAWSPQLAHGILESRMDMQGNTFIYSFICSFNKHFCANCVPRIVLASQHTSEQDRLATLDELTVS